MLSARSSPSTVTKSHHGEGCDDPITIKEFLKNLAKDTARLTYRGSRQVKSLLEPTEGTETSKHETRCRFLPLLPLPDPDVQLDTRDDSQPGFNDAVEIQASRPPARRRSRSPKILKVYSNAKRSVPARNIESGRDGDDHALDHANPVSCEKVDHGVTTSLAQKWKKGAEPVSAEDGDLMVDQSLPQKRIRPRRLQVSGLALARTIPSPIVSEDDSEKNPYLDQPIVTDTIAPPEIQASPQALNQHKANTKKARRPKSMSKIRASLKVPVPERICSKDFIFPTTPATPQKIRSLDWTPGSGFAGLLLNSKGPKPKVPIKRSRPRDRRSDPIYTGQLKVKKVSALTHSNDDSPTAGRMRAKRKKLSDERTAPFSEDSATARNLLDQAAHSSTDRVARRNVQSSYKAASDCRDERFLQLTYDKEAALGANVAGEPDPRVELVDDVRNSQERENSGI